MNIGIDVDGVLTDFRSFEQESFAKILYEKSKKLENLDYFKESTSKVFNIDENLDDEIWEEILEDFSKDILPRRYASEVLKKLSKMGHKIHIITARESMKKEDKKVKKIENLLLLWLKKHDIYYDSINFTTSNKLQKIKELKIDVMIEDSPKNILKIQDYTEIILMNNIYNMECNNPKYIRAGSFYEILYIIENFNKFKRMEKHENNF